MACEDMHNSFFGSLQALQTRKVPFVPAQFPGAKYDPDIHRSSTVAAGSVIQQVYCSQLLCMEIHSGESQLALTHHLMGLCLSLMHTPSPLSCPSKA